MKITVFTFEKKNQFQRQLAVPIHADLITPERKTCTKILSKFISKLPTVRSNVCLSELPGTEPKAPSYRSMK